MRRKTEQLSNIYDSYSWAGVHCTGAKGPSLGLDSNVIVMTKRKTPPCVIGIMGGRIHKPCDGMGSNIR